MKLGSIIFSIVFSSLILFNSARVSFTYAYYELDPIGFIEKLCENKDKPELQCNGKCHLKKVAESAPIDNKKPTRLIDFKDIQLYPQNIDGYTFLQIITEEIAKIEIIKGSYSVRYGATLVILLIWLHKNLAI